MQYLKNNGLIIESQRGLKAKRSCEMQLFSLIDELLQEMAKGK